MASARLQRNIDEVRAEQREQQRSRQPQRKGGPETLAEKQKQIGQVDGRLGARQVGDGGDKAGDLAGEDLLTEAIGLDEQRDQVDGDGAAEEIAEAVAGLGDAGF